MYKSYLQQKKKCRKIHKGLRKQNNKDLQYLFGVISNADIFKQADKWIEK